MSSSPLESTRPVYVSSIVPIKNVTDETFGKSSSLPSQQQKAPLKSLVADSYSDNDDNYLPRIVSQHPLDRDSSIETIIEPVYDATSNPTGDRQFRVVVKNGPDPVLSHVHASFLLPENTQLPSHREHKGHPIKPSLLAWTHFGEKKDSKATTDQSPLSTFLCVLAHPNLLSIYNVYPQPNREWTVQQEGWTVPLPLECSSIFPIPGGGLLLQRVPDESELNAVILEPPPQQQQKASGFSPSTAFSQPVEANVGFGNLPALFVMRHYQEDPTPLAHQQNGFWNDPLERVCFVGESHSYISPKQSSSAPSQQKDSLEDEILLVSYHSQLQRHSVWSLHRAPPPPKPPTLPMYYAARHNYHPPSNASGFSGGLPYSSTLPPAFLWDHDDDMDDNSTSNNMMNLDPMLASQPRTQLSQRTRRSHGASVQNSDFGHSFTRQEALAEVLGVNSRKTPTAASVAAGTVNSSRRGPPSLFSPAASSQHPMDTSLNAGGHASIHLDEFANPLPPMNMAVTNFFSTIHSHFVAKCLYQEAPKSSPNAASNIFLASDTKALGLTVLALLVDQTGGGASERKRLILLQPLAALENALSRGTVRRMEPISVSIDCVDAQPIQSTPLVLPIKKCGGTQEKYRFATDILILKPDGRLVLYRSHIQLATLSYSTAGKSLPSMVSLADPVGCRVTLVGPESWNRISVRLAMPCPFAEQALCAIQSSLETLGGSLDQVALLFRVDCIRVLQKLLEDEPLVGGLPFKALAACVMAIARWDLLGETTVDACSSKVEPMGSDHDDWASLQSSDFGLEHDVFPVALNASVEDEKHWLHSAYTESNPQTLNCLTQQERLGPLTPLLFDPLHMLFEESKLSNMTFPSDLESLLAQICNASSNTKARQLFLQYYESSCLSSSGDDNMLVEDTEGTRPFTSFARPPSIFSWVDALFKRTSSTSYFESINPEDINPACRCVRFTRTVLPLIFENGTSASAVVNLLIEEGFREQKEISEVLVPGIAFPLLSLLYKLTNEASQEAFVDTGALSPEGFDLIGRNDLSLNLSENDSGAQKAVVPPIPLASMPLTAAADIDPDGNQYATGSFADEEKDGLVPLEVTSSMLFKDNRIHEAARLLRSSRPAFLRVPRVVEISDHEYEQLKQKKLSLIVRRSLALPVGRGMITIGGLKPLAAELLPIPELSLKGRLPPTNASLTLDAAECPPEIKVWPEFHNGVAAGLRLPEKNDIDESDNPINRTWILYNRPPRTEPSSAEDGSSTNNSKNHAHGGFLLALGLRGHLTALEMTDIYEYLTQGTISLTVGVLLGMAANKRGTCDMSISKMLCLHIPSLIPQHFSAIDVASAVQASAVTGVGLLYQRSSHRMMTEFLLNEVGKRPDSDTSAFDREAYTLSCGIALGMVNLCIAEKSGQVDRAAGISDLRVEERLRRYIAGGQSNEEEARRVRESNDRFSIPASSNGVENEKCSIIFETNMINTDITSPAATIALGLMYMKSGNHTIASAVAIPQTHFTLEFVRPDFLGLRVVARSLILWDEIEPTQDWIDQQVPNVIHSAYHSMRTIAKRTVEGRTPVKMRGVDYDRRAVRQIYANIVAGACFSIGLHYAGTGDERAKKALFDCVVRMQKLREGSDAVSVVSKPEFPILETCLGLTAISLGMVMAGTGDLDSLRLFKTLRWRHDKEISYGTHMVFGAAIGLLFLGGGTMTLGREPEDIAALIAAFFPRFPTESTDNQYHLQALRHLYALAAKKSDVCAIDVDTGERVFVPVETISDGTQSTQLQVPFLLLNSDSPVHSLRVVSDEFYPMEFRLDKGTNNFFVKRRGPPEPQSLAGSLASDNDMTKMLSQLDYLSLHPVDKPFFTQLVSHKQAKDRYGIILIFLALMNGLRCVDPISSRSIDLMWNLRLMRSFMEIDVAEESGGNRYLPIESRILPFLLERAFQKLVPLDGSAQHLVSILYG